MESGRINKSVGLIAAVLASEPLRQLLAARVHINTAEEATQFYNDRLKILDEGVFGPQR